MASLPYEILLRFDDDGKYKGGHTIRRDSVTGKLSDAQPVGKDKAFDWPDIAAEINTASLAALSERDAELATAKGAITEQETALNAAQAEIAKKEAGATAAASRIAELAAAETELTAKLAAQSGKATAAAESLEKLKQGLTAEKPDLSALRAEVAVALQTETDRKKSALAKEIAERQAALAALA